MHGLVKDITGNHYKTYNVTKLDHIYHNGKRNVYVYECVCDECGNSFLAKRQNIVSGKTSCSCGKSPTEVNGKKKRIYGTWQHMKQRCKCLLNT